MLFYRRLNGESPAIYNPSNNVWGVTVATKSKIEWTDTTWNPVTFELRD
jgi:hypothetical protein